MSDEPDDHAEGPPRSSGARRLRGARRISRGSERASPGETSETAIKALSGLLAATIAGSVLAIGAVHVPVLFAVAAAAITSAALAFFIQAEGGKRLPLSLPVAALLALSAYSLLQAAPMPLAWLEAVAPHRADIWSRALEPFGEPSPSWASVSLDPSSSVIEALKWLVYAAVFASASVTSRFTSRTTEAPSATISAVFFQSW